MWVDDSAKPTAPMSCRGYALDHPPNPDPATLSGQIVLAPVTVAPYSTFDYSLDSIIGQLPSAVPYCSIRIQYSGAPGMMVAQVSSVETKSDMVIDAAVANEGDGWRGSGANPWHLDSQTESIVFLTDASDKPARIGFSVTAGGVHYCLTTLKLAPHETRAIDIRKLRDAQQLDFKKNLIPAGATDGSVNWIRLDNVAVAGRLVVMQRHIETASNYDCCDCYCAATYGWYNLSSSVLQIVPAGATILAGSTQLFHAYAYYADCNNNGYSQNVDGYDSLSWSSDSPSVASVAWITTGGNVTGQTGGSTTIRASFSDCGYWMFDPEIYVNNGGCNCMYDTSSGGSASVTVVAPYPTGFVQSGSSGGGGYLQFLYQWRSSTGNIADLQNCQVGELVTYPTQQSTYFWPFDVWSASTPNPTQSNVPGNWQCSTSLPAGCVIDQQFHGYFISHPASDGFTAYQTFQYQCPGVNNGNFVTLQGPNAIQRSVLCAGSTCTYTITKTGSSDSCIIGQNCN